jgi:hypothetical protein
MSVGGLPNNMNTNFAAELLAAELQQMTIRNVLTAQLNAAAAAVAAGMSYGNNGGSTSQSNFSGNVPGVSNDTLQALQALQFSPGARSLGMHGLPSAPVSWP